MPVGSNANRKLATVYVPPKLDDEIRRMAGSMKVGMGELMAELIELGMRSGVGRGAAANDGEALWERAKERLALLAERRRVESRRDQAIDKAKALAERELAALDKKEARLAHAHGVGSMGPARAAKPKARPAARRV